jgi:hypothetical protein
MFIWIQKDLDENLATKWSTTLLENEKKLNQNLVVIANIIMLTSLNPVPNAHVCVHTNYISKTSLYTTFRMYPSRPWPLKILMFALLVTREIATYS